MTDTGDSGSSEDNIKWLRDHGVTVETPADRVAAKKNIASLLELDAADPNNR